MPDFDDVLDDVAPPRLCDACARPLNVSPVEHDSLVVELVCPVHGVVGRLDVHDLL